MPIDAALPDLVAAVRDHGRAVLEAPPGAGKTTRVPLALMQAGVIAGRIVMLEPRRLAARAAAERMAETLGEPVGQTVGYAMRGDVKVSDATLIEVVTEGILTRRLQTDPELAGVGAVIFDEFHERSLNADLGLALCLEVAGALRDDLVLIAMSATLDAGPVAELMQAPVIRSEGRSFPVDIRWADRPLGKARFEDAVATQVRTALSETKGGVLVFLPGEGEIRRVAGRLGALGDGISVRPLYGAMPFADQRAAIRPVEAGRKVVLSTAIAETSLTIEDVRVVIDAGRARRARFDPGSGMTRLVTEKVTRAEATQRAGRAGRVAPGVAYRLWTKGEEGALRAHPPAEIEAADLTSLALDLAQWGASADALPFLTPPPDGALAEAQALLRDLGALDAAGRITDHGAALAPMPLHPRLAHMLQQADPDAAPLAALMEARDILTGAPVDLSLRLDALRDPKRFAAERPFGVDRGAVARLREEERRLRRLAPRDRPRLTPAQMAALAYPDRIAQRRAGDAPRYVMSGGKGAVLPDGDPLSAAPFLVVTDTDGQPREARIRAALQITDRELREVADGIAWEEVCAWSRRDRRVTARRQERLGAITLDDRIWRDAPPDRVARAMLDGVADLGFTFSPAAERLRARVALMEGFPDMSDAALMETRADWLLPYLTGIRTAADWRAFDLHDALRAMLSWEEVQTLDRAAPPAFTTPLGRKIPIDYASDPPEITLRLQEMFGQTRHPTVAGRPLRVTLLSPGQKPIQTTLDIPGFWAGSYADVRKDMRGRYPKHPWPEDPTQADPTLRAKRRS
ncbi:ATP-dependent helicase [Pseudaestuariivita atlantica]|uniref:ATP-dependent helicase n=1 Tax=Pseudaestuariivita atlantica TaxID=1317121 RepID=A0A0L1JV70_9RHOB|nr:ATP-dependent helicase [Pseudaestuariivita atlantica]